MTRVKTTAAILFSAAFALTACSDPQIFDENDPNARAKESAVAGALIGGIAAAVTGDGEGDRVLAGAVAGAAVGGLIGSQLDKQAAELRRDLGNGDIDIINTGEELIVTMPQDILFAFDSDRLRPDLRSDLGVLADNLGRYPDSRVDVLGHTDNVGSASYNYDLSDRRARAVTNVLVSEGVRGSRLRAVGQGEDQPVASNLSEAGRAQNRRVEIIIRPTA